MRACSKSVLGGKIRPVTPVLFISTMRQRTKEELDYILRGVIINKVD